MNYEAKLFCEYNKISTSDNTVIEDFLIEYIVDGKTKLKGTEEVNFPTIHVDYATQISINIDTKKFHTTFSDKWQSIKFDKENNILIIDHVNNSNKHNKPYKILIYGDN